MKLLRQIVKYLRAWLRWRWRGSPRRSAAEVRLIFYNWCNQCGYYDPINEECIQCECSVSDNVDERNKLVYLTEHCPENFW